ncbi:MAG: hypothetical protein ABR574_00935 [Cryomorphaceae bacterium]|nr:hypothetical protein [Flavobacteriales bacterium]
MKLIIFFAATVAFSDALACDMCGCAMGGNYTGIYPQFTQNLIGITYQNRDFKHPFTSLNFNGESRVLSDNFDSYELWGRFYLSPRIQVLAFLPYRVHSRKESLRTTRISGIGDMAAMVNYTVFNTADTTRIKLKHSLLAGVGVKLPTGKYQQRDDSGSSLPAQFQVGNGAYALTGNLNYTLRYRNWGAQFDFNYRYNTINEWQYRFGNQVALNANVFYMWVQNSLVILPSMGISFEHYQKDEEYGVVKPETGGEIALLNAGADVYFKQFFARANIQKPIEQNLPFAQPNAGVRMNFSVGVSF